jgi:hypothetical protein
MSKDTSNKDKGTTASSETAQVRSARLALLRDRIGQGSEGSTEPKTTSDTSEGTHTEKGSGTRATAEREIGGMPFRDAYLTKSVHFIPEVWEAFKQLRPDTGKSLTKLQNEAMAWLLTKYGAMTPELRALFDEFHIEVPPI